MLNVDLLQFRSSIRNEAPLTKAEHSREPLAPALACDFQRGPYSLIFDTDQLLSIDILFTLPVALLRYE